MKFRKTLLVALCAASIGGLAAPMAASAAVEVYLNAPPPPPRYEVVPAPRTGYIWVPGYWDVRNSHHYWRAGHWEKHRHGYHYAEPSWTQHGDRWQLNRGGWSKGDRDGDGVPNSMDRQPDNPKRQ